MLQPQLPGPVPADTARIACAAFPKGSPLLALRDELGAIFSDNDFADLYPAIGQPAYPPWRLALITVLQFREGLPDRQAADARSGPDRLESTSSASRSAIPASISPSSPSSGPASLSTAPRASCSTGFSRPAVSVGCSRREGGSGPIRLTSMARGPRDEPARARGRDGSGRAERAGRRGPLTGSSGSLGPSGTTGTAGASRTRGSPGRRRAGPGTPMPWALTGTALLAAVGTDEAPPGLASLPEGSTRSGGSGRATTSAVGQAGCANSGSSAVAGPGRRGDSVGVPLRRRRPVPAETRDDLDGLHGAPDRDVRGWTGPGSSSTPTPPRPVDVHEAARTEPILAALGRGWVIGQRAPRRCGLHLGRPLGPKQRTASGVRLVGPPRKDPSWQARTEGGYTADRFRLDWGREVATCPEGEESRSWRTYSDREGSEYVVVRFAPATCRGVRGERALRPGRSVAGGRSGSIRSGSSRRWRRCGRRVGDRSRERAALLRPRRRRGDAEPRRPGDGHEAIAVPRVGQDAARPYCHGCSAPRPTERRRVGTRAATGANPYLSRFARAGRVATSPTESDRFSRTRWRPLRRSALPLPQHVRIPVRISTWKYPHPPIFLEPKAHLYIGVAPLPPLPAS